MKTDALNRRSRFAPPQPLDTRIILTERDFRIFEALDRHGKLPTNYIYALTKKYGKHYNELQKRLTKLYNGYCDHPQHKVGLTGGHECRPHAYVARDVQQFNNFQANYQPAIYGLTALGKKTLEEEGRGSQHIPPRTDPFVHQFFGACVSASFELLSKSVRFMPADEILAHAKCPEETRSAEDPFAIPTGNDDVPTLVPDNLFGLAYPRDDGQESFRFFAVEIDRNTESVDPKKPVKNSIARKLKGYTTILEGRAYESHFGLPNISVLFATTNSNHMRRMIDLVKRDVPPRFQHKFLFKTFAGFGENWVVPRETLDVYEPWDSAIGSVDISKRATA